MTNSNESTDMVAATNDSAWMIYGANGYTGLRIARAARDQGMQPVLAGRNAKAIAALATELGLPWRVFDLNNAQASCEALQGIAVVAHCAGPYSATSVQMVDACIATGTHYVDITGEIDVIVANQVRDAEARAVGIAICPGAGFDVIPTDCLAATLKQAMPDATHLTLGFTGLDTLSPGTMKTSLESIGHATSKIRKDGELIDIPYFTLSRTLDFGDGNGPVAGFNIPWADAATAYYSTGIPNCEVFVPRSSGIARSMSLLKPMVPILRSAAVVKLLKRLVDITVKGPSAAQFENETGYVFGEVRNAKGEVQRAQLTTPNGYRLTVDGVLMTVRHLFDHPQSKGFYMPSMLMGANCVERLPGVSPIKLFEKQPG